MTVRAQSGGHPEAAGSQGLASASRTAEVTAAMRAAETLMPPRRRLFDDPYAQSFLEERMYRLLCSSRPVARVSHRLFDRGYAGLNVEHHLRNRYYEDRLERAREAGVRQVVMVGAGYDSLALRHRLEGTTVFEVDAPPTQRRKRELLTRAGLSPKARVTYVGCDFETDRLSERLADAGLDASLAAFGIFLGVSYYLTESAVRSTLRELATTMAPGSQLVFDYMDSSVIDGTTTFRGARRAAASVAKRGEPYTFGLAPGGLDGLLAGTGFVLQEHLRVSDLVTGFSPPPGVWCRTDDFMGVVLAQRAGEP